MRWGYRARTPVYLGALRRLYPYAIVVLAGHLDSLEQVIDFRAGFFMLMFFDLFG